MGRGQGEGGGDGGLLFTPVYYKCATGEKLPAKKIPLTNTIMKEKNAD